jgi:hypothetical protein
VDFLNGHLGIFKHTLFNMRDSQVVKVAAPSLLSSRCHGWLLSKGAVFVRDPRPFPKSSLRVHEHVVVVRGDSPVLAVVVFLWEIFLVVSEECVELDALLEVLDGFHASDLLQEVEITIHVDASADQSVPVDALESDIGVVLLEFEVDSLEEVNVRALNGVHVVARHLKLIEIEVLGEDLHLKYISININYSNPPCPTSIILYSSLF